MVKPRWQVEQLPEPAVCYWPMVMGPWGEDRIYVIVWLWFYVTVWVGFKPGRSA